MGYSNRYKATPAVLLRFRRDGKTFLMRRCNTGFADKYYELPAGHVEAGELPIEAALRECKEETGIDVSADNLTCVHVMYRPAFGYKGHYTCFFFDVGGWEGEPYIAEPEKCDDAGWFANDEFPSRTTPYVHHALDCVDKGIFYSQLDDEWMRKNAI